ncbi:sugar ABC transporter permease [Nannocystis pusilla]|uniref:sugar ABC transporter permease n=1 Tax=Nannocystis pusilla TaxID=889268 RepID=UPI003B818E71
MSPSGQGRKVSLAESIGAHLLLVVAVAFALYPLLWVVSLAFSGAVEPTPRVLPVPLEPTLEHLRGVAFSTLEVPGEPDRWLFGLQLANSIVISLATALVGVVIAVPTAYALARFEFVGKEGGVRALLATQMFPAVASAIPYIILDGLGLLGTRSGLVLCYATTAVPFAIFQLRGAFETIPRDLEEAAMVDGATRFEAFRKVVLPAARPAIAVTALFAFMSAYNEFVLAHTMLGREEMYTVPVVLQRYISEFSADWPNSPRAR